MANFCAERMHEVIAQEWDRETVDGYEWQRKWETAFSIGFEKADNELLEEAIAPEMVGSTAVVAILSGCQIITSNCGDSRAVLCRGTETIPLTVDQKVTSLTPLFFKLFSRFELFCFIASGNCSLCIQILELKLHGLLSKKKESFLLGRIKIIQFFFFFFCL